MYKDNKDALSVTNYFALVATPRKLWSEEVRTRNARVGKPPTSLLNLASPWLTRGATNGTVPASTTPWASSGVCFAISANVQAAVRRSESSGSYTNMGNNENIKISFFKIVSYDILYVTMVISLD